MSFSTFLISLSFIFDFFLIFTIILSLIFNPYKRLGMGRSSVLFSLIFFIFSQCLSPLFSLSNCLYSTLFSSCSTVSHRFCVTKYLHYSCSILFSSIYLSLRSFCMFHLTLYSLLYFIIILYVFQIMLTKSMRPLVDH